MSVLLYLQDGQDATQGSKYVPSDIEHVLWLSEVRIVSGTFTPIVLGLAGSHQDPHARRALLRKGANH